MEQQIPQLETKFFIHGISWSIIFIICFYIIFTLCFKKIIKKIQKEDEDLKNIKNVTQKVKITNEELLNNLNDLKITENNVKQKYQYLKDKAHYLLFNKYKEKTKELLNIKIKNQVMEISNKLNNQTIEDSLNIIKKHD